MFLSRVAAVAILLIVPAGLTAKVKRAGPHHPHMHYALHELKEARVELKEAAHDFGGHREKALKAVDAAIVQIEIALKAAGDPYKSGKVTADHYKKYERHPHIHHAIVELKKVREELKEAKHDFGGHREKALKDTDEAIVQLEKALKFDRK